MKTILDDMSLRTDLIIFAQTFYFSVTPSVLLASQAGQAIGKDKALSKLRQE
jgi:hypothetical protein